MSLMQLYLYDIAVMTRKGHSNQGTSEHKILYARPQSWLVEIRILKIGPQNHGLFALT